MRVFVETKGCPFELELTRVVRLFLDPVEIRFRHEPDDSGQEVADEVCDVQTDADLWLTLSLTWSSEEVRATGQLTVGAGSTKRTSFATHTYGPKPAEKSDSASAKKLGSEASEFSSRKRHKHVVLHVLHQLLTEFSGASTPWGYLTGIRPSKLVHKMLLNGKSEREVKRELQSEYRVSDSRAALLLEVAAVETSVVPDLYRLDDAVSIYVGIPFCPTHCAYCTFPAYSMAEKAFYVDDFLAAMEQELRHLGGFLRERNIPVTTVYVGGGTPTSLQAKELERMLTSIRNEIPGSWRELCVEAGRPDTITPDRLRVMKDLSVGRISVNPQTYKAETLRHIRRGHTPDQVDHRFRAVREAGFDNINMDVILGLPGETVEDVRHTMERIGRLDPDSITVHTMALKRSSAVTNDKEQYRVPDDESVVTMMREADSFVRGLGHRPYYLYRQMDILGNLENIGFAKPGKECIYNISIIEERQTIVGIGGGAVTKVIGPDAKHVGRLANPREPKAYIETIGAVLEKKDALLRKRFDGVVAGSSAEGELDAPREHAL